MEKSTEEFLESEVRKRNVDIEAGVGMEVRTLQRELEQLKQNAEQIHAQSRHTCNII